MPVPKYNPHPPATVYRIAVFNPDGHGVAEFETAAGLYLDARKAACQEIADRIPEGYTVQIFDTVYTIGRTTAKSRMIHWE